MVNLSPSFDVASSGINVNEKFIINNLLNNSMRRWTAFVGEERFLRSAILDTSLEILAGMRIGAFSLLVAGFILRDEVLILILRLKELNILIIFNIPIWIILYMIKIYKIDRRCRWCNDSLSEDPRVRILLGQMRVKAAKGLEEFLARQALGNLVRILVNLWSTIVGFLRTGHEERRGKEGWTSWC